MSHHEIDEYSERLSRARLRAEALVEAHLQVPKYRDLHARMHRKLGTVMLRLGFPEEAEQSYMETANIYRTLASRFPQAATDYQLTRAFARQSLAGLLLSRNDRAATQRACKELKAAIATMEAAVTNPDDQTTVWSRLNECKAMLAKAERQLE